MTEEKTNPEVGENTSNLEQTATPAELEAEKIDERIKEIVGEEEANQDFSEEESEEQPENEEENQDDVKEEDDRQEDGREQLEVPTPPEYKPSRLDKRVANRYIRNLHLQGYSIEDIPSEEEIFEKLRGASFQEKQRALESQLSLNKMLRGETNEELEDGDIEALREEEKEEIRREVLAEEETKATMRNFVSFLDAHPELDEDKKEYDPVIAKAVEALFRDGNGMPVDEAYSLVVSNINKAREAKEKAETKRKNAALTGVMSGVGKVENDGGIDWDYVNRISQSDPDRYIKELLDGKYNHLNL